ncbi:MAG: hypothetical protein BAA04_01070 [Firmicutes bacterium ZCTH02-B6]|nr:MAG: hypothetical protein BAA04_01070 [Firmicutes bacterium ZCTH02-B6]
MPAKRMTAEELNQLFAQPNPPLVIDVRSREKYEAGHVPGAVHIPAAQLEIALADLPRDRAIVTYCGGGTSGPRAADFLLAHGFDARVMAGFRWWEKAGLPVETGGGA